MRAFISNTHEENGNGFSAAPDEAQFAKRTSAMSARPALASLEPLPSIAAVMDRNSPGSLGQRPRGVSHASHRRPHYRHITPHARMPTPILHTQTQKRSSADFPPPPTSSHVLMPAIFPSRIWKLDTARLIKLYNTQTQSQEHSPAPVPSHLPPHPLRPLSPSLPSPTHPRP